MKFGYEAYAWQIASDRYMGRVDHVVSVLSRCGFTGVEPEVCMLGDYVEEPTKLREMLDIYGVDLAAICYVEHWRQDRETDDEVARAARVTDYVSPRTWIHILTHHGCISPTIRVNCEYC